MSSVDEDDGVSISDWFVKIMKKTLMYFSMLTLSLILVGLCAMYSAEIISLSLYTKQVLLNVAP